MMTKNKHDLIRELRAAADALESGTITDAALITVQADGNVHHRWQGGSAAGHGAVWMGLRSLQAAIERHAASIPTAVSPDSRGGFITVVGYGGGGGKGTNAVGGTGGSR